MKSVFWAGLLASSCALLPATVLAAPPRLDAYGELPSVENVAISPDGLSLAQIVQTENGRRIFVSKGEALLLNTLTGEVKVRDVEWADNSTILLTTSGVVDSQGFTVRRHELSRVAILSLIAGGKLEKVFGGSSSVAPYVVGNYGVRQSGGKTFGYFGGMALERDATGTRLGYGEVRNGKAALFAVDLASNRSSILGYPADDGKYRDWLLDKDGKIAATLNLAVMDGKWEITGQKGVKLASGVAPTGQVDLLAFGDHGRTLIYYISDSSGTTKWYEVPLAGGEAKPYLDDVGINRTFIDRFTRVIVGYRTSGEDSKLVMTDPVQQGALTRIYQAFGDRRVDLMDWTPDFSKVVVRTSGRKDSGTWYLVDVQQKRADIISEERPEITGEQVGPISEVEYTASDGLQMDGVLTLPPGREARNLPIIVLPHGGPNSHDNPVFDWWAQAFASRGYAVFQPNFRGSTGRSDAFRVAGNGEWGRKMQTDISDGLAELVQKGIVDPKRACIVGASYGGYAALAGVTIQQGLYRCAVSVAGVSDINLLYRTEREESGNSPMTRTVLREQLGNPSGFSAISPRNLAARADAPILLIHGLDDLVVPFNQSQVMADALKDAKKPFEMVKLPGEDHWLSRAPTRKQMLNATMKFVEQHNPAN